MTSGGLVGAALLVAALAAGCTGDDPAVPPAHGSLGYASRPCPDDVAAAVVGGAECGTLTVPEDRDGPAGATIRLLVVTMTPPRVDHDDPMLVLGTDLATTPNYAGIAPMAQRTQRQVVVLEARGTAHSEPRLDCPPVTGPDVAAAVRECHDALVARGVDVAAYDVRAMARDAADLIAARRLGPVNAVTYGSASRITFELIRDRPELLRSVVLDSPGVPGHDDRSGVARAERSAVGRVLRWCARDRTCRARHPRPAGLLDRALAAVAVPVRVPIDGVEVDVDAALLVRLARQTLTDGGSAGTWGLPTALPALLDAAVHRDPALLAGALSELTGTQGPRCLGYRPKCMPAHVVTEGVANTVLCRDVDPYGEPPAPAGGPGFDEAYAGGWWWDVCPSWPVPPGDPVVAEPVTSDVPALVLVGALGPPTPPRAVRLGTAGLSRRTLVVAPTLSHNVLGDGCLLEFRTAWVDQPELGLSAPACLASRIRWAGVDEPPPAAGSAPGPTAEVPPSAVPSGLQGTWLSRLSRDQIRADLTVAGFGPYYDAFIAGEQIGPEGMTSALTIGLDRFEIAYRQADGSWHVGWQGDIAERDGALTITDDFSDGVYSFRWSVAGGRLTLEPVAATGSDLRGVPAEAYAPAYFSRPYLGIDCTPADLEACG